MYTLKCKMCGADFESWNSRRDYCRDCCVLHSIHPEKRKSNYDPNAKLREDVREATKQGLSYGNYKGR